jgi:hypothetical protein
MNKNFYFIILIYNNNNLLKGYKNIILFNIKNNIMNSFVSSIAFIFSFLVYIHIRHYYKISDEYEIIILNEMEHLNNVKTFDQLIEDSGRAKLPCVFKNSNTLTNISTLIGYDITYLNLLMDLNELKLCVPFTYYSNKTNLNGDNLHKSDLNSEKIDDINNDHKLKHDIYLTIEACQFMDNNINVNRKALVYSNTLSNNKKNITEKQLKKLNIIYNSLNKYANKYLYNQYIIRRSHSLYFSNYDSDTYIQFQYFKNPLNVFYVLDGECEIIMVHPSLVKKDVIENDYVFFRFYYDSNVFDNENNDLNNILREHRGKVNKIKCNKGDVILLPCEWFISIKMSNQCVILNESVSSLTSTVSLAPEYLKHLFYKSTIKIVQNNISEIEDEEENEAETK